MRPRIPFPALHFGSDRNLSQESKVKRISEIEGIGPSYAEKLRNIGVKSVEDLLNMGGDAAGRKKMAQGTGISDRLVLKWVNMADLFRIKGVASQYAELLELAGVDTVKELAQRNAESLHEKMASANTERKVVRMVPGLNSVKNWVAEAKSLPRRVHY
jgi:predicted flap endonuclease-1-like 5' DNA nuclease